MPILRLENVCKAFPGVQALDNVSLEVQRGEIRALLGQNGAGKSTLVKVLSGAITRDSGKLRLTEGPWTRCSRPPRLVSSVLHLFIKS